MRVADTPLKWSLIPDKSGKVIDQKSGTWSDFCATFTDPPEYAAKASMAWFKGATFGTVSGPGGSLRHDANVLEVYTVEGDYDAGIVSLEAAAAMAEAAGTEVFFYTTASHTPERPKWRAIAPLSKPCMPGERRHHVGVLNAALGGILATESFVLSQSYYWGRLAGAEYRTAHVEGEPLDTAGLFIEPVAPPEKDRHAGPLPVEEMTEGEIADFTERLSSAGPENFGVGTRIARFLPLIMACMHAERCGHPTVRDMFADLVDRYATEEKRQSWEKTWATDKPKSHWRTVFDLVPEPLPTTEGLHEVAPTHVRKGWQQREIERLLPLIDPDGGVNPMRVLSAVHFELGAEAGEGIARGWIARGSKRQDPASFDTLWHEIGSDSDGWGGDYLVRQAYPDALPELTVIGNARRILRHFPGVLRHVAETGQWYRWTGSRWRACTESEVLDMGRQVVEEMPLDAFLYPNLDDRKKYLQWCAKSAMRAWPNAVATVAELPEVLTPAASLDQHSHLLGVKNGVVDLRTGELLPPDPGLCITLCAGADFDPYAACPIFQRVVSEVFFDDAEMVAFFLRALGYTLLANPREELVFIPHGNGANGKSKIFEAVGAALGGYAKSCAAETLMDAGSFAGGGGGAREDLVRLRGTRLLLAAEPEEGARLRESLVKSMSGGDLITARAPYAKASIEIAPTWAVWMPTNHRPIVKGDDFGIWRRICLIPFQRNFKSDPHIKADPHLGDKLRAELPGVLALLVRSAVEYQRHGLGLPEKVRKASEAYRGDMDILATWLDEACDTGPGLEASSGDLWRSWRAFADERRLHHILPNETAFGRRMEQRFPGVRKASGRYRKGVSLKQGFDLFAPQSEGGGAPLRLISGGQKNL